MGSSEHSHVDLVPIRQIGAEGTVNPAPQIELSDLSADPDQEAALREGGFAVVVDVLLPEGAVPHPSMRAFVKQHLTHCNPGIYEEEGYLRILFAVEDHGPGTMDRIGLFTRQLACLFGTDAAGYQPFNVEHSPKEW